MTIADTQKVGRSPASLCAVTGTRLRVRATVVACALLLSACAAKRGGNIPYFPDEASFGAPDSPALTVLENDYRIAPLDKIKVTVFQVPDLTADYEVDLTGDIAMPLIGTVRAVNLTTDQLDQKITAALAAKYLQSPDVNIAVTASSTRQITVDGSVRDPGMFPIAGPMTLIQAIALAKGPDGNANPRRVAIFRQIGGERMAAAFDLTDIRRGNAEDPRVYAGDIVVVDGSKVTEVRREILSSLPIISVFRPFY